MPVTHLGKGMKIRLTLQRTCSIIIGNNKPSSYVELISLKLVKSILRNGLAGKAKIQVERFE